MYGFGLDPPAHHPAGIEYGQLHLLQHHALLVHPPREGAVKALEVILPGLSGSSGLFLICPTTGAEGLPLDGEGIDAFELFGMAGHLPFRLHVQGAVVLQELVLQRGAFGEGLQSSHLLQGKEVGREAV